MSNRDNQHSLPMPKMSGIPCAISTPVQKPVASVSRFRTPFKADQGKLEKAISTVATVYQRSYLDRKF